MPLKKTPVRRRTHVFPHGVTVAFRLGGRCQDICQSTARMVPTVPPEWSPSGVEPLAPNSMAEQIVREPVIEELRSEIASRKDPICFTGLSTGTALLAGRPEAGNRRT
ncbi:GTPase Era [Anopheles sinensis]|uniref:GTPase Era n=1 Tax=Anopheles sinensis TaxID=74873 RepID=A0A084VT64_ANOSI|nr:GTPase Era [Anopheles sinensis]